MALRAPAFHAKFARVFRLLLLVLTICAGLWPQAGFALPESNRVPPMGWEPWNFSHCDSRYAWDEAYYDKLAHVFVTSGLRDAGYTYVTIECHEYHRDAAGRIQADARTLPHGFRRFTDRLHAVGLKARFYTDAGVGRCDNDLLFDSPGSYGHYAEDAEQWRAFGFDGVKIDWCGGYAEHRDPEKQYREFAQSMFQQNPNFSVEICSWGQGSPWKWGRFAGTFWRTGTDIDWAGGNGALTFGGHWAWLLRNIDANRHPDTAFVGPGKGWNYPDMLEVGVPGGLNEMEERTQFSMWAMMASPLILGNDVFKMSPYTRETLLNHEVIAIDQDALGVQGDVIWEDASNKVQVWSKPLHDGTWAIAVLNRDEEAHAVDVRWESLGLKGPQRVRDLWRHKEMAHSAEKLQIRVSGHETAVLKLSPVQGRTRSSHTKEKYASSGI